MTAIVFTGRITTINGDMQGRHPSGRAWRPDRAVLAERVAQRAAGGGARWPRVAAATLVIRGLAGDDVATFAARLGLATDDVAALERGDVAPSHLPARLRAIEGIVDWQWVDADPGHLIR
jgi:hypothetical protein